MLSTENMNNALRAVASTMQDPVVFILLVILALAVILAGTLIAECFTERLRLKVKLPQQAESIPISI